MKILRKDKLLENKFVERQYREYKNLSLLYHPFIIELKGINHIDPYNLYYLFEFVPGQSLKFYIKAYKNLPKENAKFYSASIITILDYIHKKNIIHRDIRPENIFLNDNGYIKLGEFNFSKKLKNDLTYSLCGIPEYYSPEMINKTGHNKSIDFWQLGILLYEMLVGKTPFIDSDPVKIYKKVNEGKLHFPKSFDRNAKNIIKQFLNVNMNKRLGCLKKGIYDIIKHPFFKDFDWEGLLHRRINPPFTPNILKLANINNYRIMEEMVLEENKEALNKEKDPFYNWS